MTVKEYLDKCREELKNLPYIPENEVRCEFLSHEINAKYMVEHDELGDDWYYKIIDRPSERTILLQMMRHFKDFEGYLVCKDDPEGEIVKIRRYANKMEYQEPENKKSKFEFADSIPNGPNWVGVF